jgi:hypothetical protein
MKPTSLKYAADEARRFLLAVSACKIESDCGFSRIESGKEAAKVRRASMDLSRALADLRQGR